MLKCLLIIKLNYQLIILWNKRFKNNIEIKTIMFYVPMIETQNSDLENKIYIEHGDSIAVKIHN